MRKVKMERMVCMMLVGLIALASCAKEDPAKAEQKFDRPVSTKPVVAKPVIAKPKNYRIAITAVKRTMTNVSTSGRVYQTGFLEDGVAVFVDNLAAYWVQNGRVYAANGFAKTWSPSISYSKTGIDIDSVENAVQ